MTSIITTGISLIATAINVGILIYSSNKRIADLESKIQDQQEKIMLLKEATVTGKKIDFVS